MTWVLNHGSIFLIDIDAKSANMLLYCIQVLSACFQSLQQLSKLAFSFISAVFHRIARVPLIRRSVGSWEPVFPRAAAAPR